MIWTYFTVGHGIESSSDLEYNQIVLKTNGYDMNSILDIVSDKYNNTGYINLSLRITSNKIWKSNIN